MVKLLGLSSAFILSISCLTRAQQSVPRLPATSGTPQAQSRPPVQQTEEVGEGEVIRIKASLVSVPVSVMNRQGIYITDLQPKDFRIYEDGVEQSIAHFSTVDQSFSAVMLMDTSGSTASFLNQIKTSARYFIEQLRLSDTVQPVYFHGEIKALTAERTNDTSVLRAAIDQMSSGPINMGTRLYDAVDFALSELKSATTRKAVILFTDGENTWGRATSKGTLKEAEESDVIFYTIQYGDDPPQKYLQQLAEKTGGRYFKTADLNTIKQSFAEVAEELRRQYVIGYHPVASGQIGQLRQIRVRVNRHHAVVRARKSYVYHP